jgi:hypothetical protein
LCCSAEITVLSGTIFVDRIYNSLQQAGLILLLILEWVHDRWFAPCGQRKVRTSQGMVVRNTNPA